MALFLSKKPSSPTADNTLPMHGDNDKHDCRAVVISLRKMSCTCYTRCLGGGNKAPKAHSAYIYKGEKVISLQFLFSYFDEPIGGIRLMTNRW